MSLSVWLRKISGMQARGGNHDRQNRPTPRNAKTPPRLEQLEDRLTPSTFDTVTNVYIWTNPSLSERGIERITAVVTPVGTGTPVTNGNVVFSINNNQIATVPVNNFGSPTFGFAQVDVAQSQAALSSNQTVQAVYQGGTVGADTFNPSMFSAPVFLNMMNAQSTSFISFVGSTDGTVLGENDSILFFFQPSLTGNLFTLVQYSESGSVTNMMSF